MPRLSTSAIVDTSGPTKSIEHPNTASGEFSLIISALLRGFLMRVDRSSLHPPRFPEALMGPHSRPIGRCEAPPQIRGLAVLEPS